MSTRKRYTDEQVIRILQEAESGVSAVEVCRRHEVSIPTFYKWKKKYGGLEGSDIRKLRALEDENSKLRRIVSNLSLDVHILKEANELLKKM